MLGGILSGWGRRGGGGGGCGTRKKLLRREKKALLGREAFSKNKEKKDSLIRGGYTTSHVVRGVHLPGGSPPVSSFC